MSQGKAGSTVTTLSFVLVISGHSKYLKAAKILEIGVISGPSGSLRSAQADSLSFRTPASSFTRFSAAACRALVAARRSSMLCKYSLAECVDWSHCEKMPSSGLPNAPSLKIQGVRREWRKCQYSLDDVKKVNERSERRISWAERGDLRRET